ncbi:glycosyltransferase family 4 protein [Candidatus Uabimicrobium amorphum]|uniref:Glycosyl transferase family 1 n=1 Tax=Uabimicrobium amorphum TaxID=2596890 RepID=A0A5S9IPI7_UABAM|nr:glycosyltransferase family 4 protein [Candidatus Uabimicrobium amorphum]BBM85091.1 glycosyl transferase family 1 [Candidatus Uabimicrobium amorphum]
MTKSYKPKKHLFLSELYPPTIGGSCTMFAGRFENERNIVVLTKEIPNSSSFDEAQSYCIVRKKMSYDGPNGFEWWGMVKRFVLAAIPIIRKHKVQVIQCARPIPEGIAGLILSVVLRKKLVINYHGEDISVFQRYKVERFLLKKMLEKAHLNLFNSSYTKSIADDLTTKKVQQAIIHPGFSPEKLQNNCYEGSHYKEKNLNILTVGRFQCRKGQDHVIHAMAKIVQFFPKVHYTMIGSEQGGTENWSHHLRQLAKDLDLEENVSILEDVADEHMLYFYKNCDVFVMPNRKDGDDVEGFGIVFIEAGFCGKPVIGGLVGGSVDAIENEVTGYLVDGENVDEIASKIKEILKDKKLAGDLGRRGYQRSLNFTHKALCVKYKNELGKRNL